MSRQLEQKTEERTARKQVALVRALEFEMAGSLEAVGITMVGFAIKWDAWECLLTLKADIGGVRNVAFIGSDSPINAILKTVAATQNDRLRWKVDKYAKSGD